MSDLVSTGGGHHHPTGCTCPFCTSTTHAEATVVLDPPRRAPNGDPLHLVETVSTRDVNPGDRVRVAGDVITVASVAPAADGPGFEIVNDLAPRRGAVVVGDVVDRVAPEAVTVSELTVGDQVRLEAGGDTCTVTSVDNDHRSTSIEFDDDESTIASYDNDDLVWWGRPALSDAERDELLHDGRYHAEPTSVAWCDECDGYEGVALYDRYTHREVTCLGCELRKEP